MLTCTPILQTNMAWSTSIPVSSNIPSCFCLHTRSPTLLVSFTRLPIAPRHKLQLQEPRSFSAWSDSFVTSLTACPRPNPSLVEVLVSLAHRPPPGQPLIPAKCDWAGTRHNTHRLLLLKLRKFHSNMRKNCIWGRHSSETRRPGRAWSLPL